MEIMLPWFVSTPSSGLNCNSHPTGYSDFFEFGGHKAMVNNQSQANRTTTLNTKITAKIRIIVDSTKYQYRKFGIDQS